MSFSFCPPHPLSILPSAYSRFLFSTFHPSNSFQEIANITTKHVGTVIDKGKVRSTRCRANMNRRTRVKEVLYFTVHTDRTYAFVPVPLHASIGSASIHATALRIMQLSFRFFVNKIKEKKFDLFYHRNMLILFFF